MARLEQVARRVRSKNAGPFTLTIDIFCDAETFAPVCNALSTARVAAVYGLERGALKRFELDALHVLKFSMPRPAQQGSLEDRDMHASQWAWLLAELELNV
jgi:hypothetical protein